MFLHYSDYGANCSDLNVNGLFFAAHYETALQCLFPLSPPPLSSPLSDLSEVEGWEKESERNTPDQEGRKSHWRDKAALLVVCGSSACWELE